MALARSRYTLKRSPSPSPSEPRHVFKHAVFVVLETLLFLALFLVFSVVLPGIGRIPMWRMHVSATHDFVPTGLIAMLVAYVILLGIAAARRRLKGSGMRVTLAFVLAICLGLAFKIGLIEPLAGGLR
jgi:hypothetical protein